MTVNVFRTELLMGGVADIVYFQNRLPRELALYAQKVIIDVRIANALGENDSRQHRRIGTERGPSSEVPGGLRANTLPDIGRGAGERRRHSVVLCANQSRAVA